ncbi:TonB-dependent receptor plug domain-containing protein [Novosphingobium flavum]|uniref:TonB-dependent receptor plug domain-containing protein n=2 Tax=Novosphingobium flavum TaxID=1778672 RepID=A0A7X1FQT7_9SPHN|nr:TonB-dependent receptor plug domain-containing protein [Novosphingobium flavum]
MRSTQSDPARFGRRRKTLLAAATLLACTAMTAPAFAEEAEAEAADAPAGEEIVVKGALNALPVKDVGTIFGFDKNLVETPRSASTVSKEQIERFGITDIHDLIAQAPGTFTNSFFGVSGSLDIRGTPGETYFRGMRRLDNPGNYPTPIGAADRIDIVRGPASPIMGPAKTGGYINFVPKTARVAGGSFMSEPKAEIEYTRSAWNGSKMAASVVGPGKLGDHEFGYSLYGELTNSDSYYRYVFTHQTLLQAAFDTDITDKLRLEFGGMYQNYRGVQNGGWNRVTQDLIDKGIYTTGQAKPLDTNADGKISQAEARAANGGAGLGLFGSFVCGGGILASGLTNSCLAANVPDLGLTNVGTAILSPRNTLTGQDDKLDSNVKTAYADLIWGDPESLEIKNQFFYDGYYNINENAYGFSQFADSYVIEDKIVATKKVKSALGTFSFQLAPSIRYTNFKHADDFGYEYFGRVDLTQGYTPLSTRLLSTQTDSGYSSYFTGHYSDASVSALTDLNFDFGLDLTLGGRYDYLSVTSNAILSKMDSTQFWLNIPTAALTTSADLARGYSTAKGSKGVWSWTASANYKLPFGLVPYGTIAKQAVIIAGQGAEVDPNNVYNDTWVTDSKLYEGGIKGSWLDNTLYAALSVYKQTRTDYTVGSLTVNQAIKTTGVEAEVRWSVDKHLLLTGAYTHTKVVNLPFLNGGGTFFYYYGAELVKSFGVNPALLYGGAPNGYVTLKDASMAERPGIPKNLYSATATYSFDNGLALSASASHVESVWADYAHTLKLPAYTLVDLGVTYETDHWMFRFNLKNALNQRYFRANFVELYGSQNVLPELPRSWQASIKYKF